MSTSLVEKIKESEGFIGNEYKDSLEIPTIGFGTKLPISKAEGELLLSFRLNKMISDLLEEKPIIFRFPQERQEVLFEMCYQMGVKGLLNFKMMWLALENFDYIVAAEEILDSRLARQTPKRAKKYADIMRGNEKA